MSNIAFLCNGSREWASSRLRGYWYEDIDPVHIHAYEPGSELLLIDECDAVVFQKRFKLPDIERAFRYKREGKKIILDLTDPMWWWFPKEVFAMFELADVVTTSCNALSEVVRASGKVERVVTIPDRMLPSFHPTTVQHRERDRIVMVWYGDSGNRIALQGYLPFLGFLAHEFPIELQIIDNAPGIKVMEEDSPHLKIRHIPWALETFHAHLLDCDIAYLPPYPGPWGMVKSNNRQVTAWWAGLPVVTGDDLGEMAKFASSVEARKEEAEIKRAIAERDWNIHQSVKEWQLLVDALSHVPNPNGNKEAILDPV